MAETLRQTALKLMHGVKTGMSYETAKKKLRIVWGPMHAMHHRRFLEKEFKAAFDEYCNTHKPTECTSEIQEMTAAYYTLFDNLDKRVHDESVARDVTEKKDEVDTRKEKEEKERLDALRVQSESKVCEYNEVYLPMERHEHCMRGSDGVESMSLTKAMDILDLKGSMPESMEDIQVAWRKNVDGKGPFEHGDPWRHVKKFNKARDVLFENLSGDEKSNAEEWMEGIQRRIKERLEAEKQEVELLKAEKRKAEEEEAEKERREAVRREKEREDVKKRLVIETKIHNIKTKIGDINEDSQPYKQVELYEKLEAAEKERDEFIESIMKATAQAAQQEAASMGVCEYELVKEPQAAPVEEREAGPVKQQEEAPMEQIGQPSAIRMEQREAVQIDQPLAAPMDKASPPSDLQTTTIDEASTLLDELPATLEQDQLDTGSLTLKEQMMSQQTRIEAYETKIEAQQLQFESMKNELADVKQVVKELLETVKGLKRIREDSDDDMSVESSVSAIKNQPRKDRKHLKKEEGSLNEDIKFKALEDEIKSFVAEEFEEKHGTHVLCCELYTIFRRSRGDGSDYEMNMFKYHVSKYFKIQWPTHTSGRFKNIRCYYNIAVKTPPQ